MLDQVDDGVYTLVALRFGLRARMRVRFGLCSWMRRHDNIADDHNAMQVGSAALASAPTLSVLEGLGYGLVPIETLCVLNADPRPLPRSAAPPARG